MPVVIAPLLLRWLCWLTVPAPSGQLMLPVVRPAPRSRELEMAIGSNSIDRNR